jgi:hypothetical protein
MLTLRLFEFFRFKRGGEGIASGEGIVRNERTGANPVEELGLRRFDFNE